MENPDRVIINKKANSQPVFTRLYIRFAVSFFSTLLLLFPLFYQVILAQPFWNQNLTLISFIVGAYGYAFLIADFAATVIKEYGGRVGYYYKKYEWYCNLLFIVIVIISLTAIFYTIFGTGAAGPFVGGVSVLLIKWWVENKVQKEKSKV